MDAPEELRMAVAEAIADASACVYVRPTEMEALSIADAVFAVPAIADALAARSLQTRVPGDRGGGSVMGAMTTPRRDLPCTPRVARLLGPRPPGPRRLRALQAPIPPDLADRVEDIVAEHLARRRGSVTGSERAAAWLGASIAAVVIETGRSPRPDDRWPDE